MVQRGCVHAQNPLQHGDTSARLAPVAFGVLLYGVEQRTQFVASVFLRDFLHDPSPVLVPLKTNGTAQALFRD